MDTQTELSQSGAMSFFNRFARALVEGKSDDIADCFSLPAFFITDTLAMCLESPTEMAEMFESGRSSYLERGIVETHPEVRTFSRLTPRLYEAEVRWPGFDARGTEMWSETSKYVLCLDDNGDPRIRVAVALGGREKI